MRLRLTGMTEKALQAMEQDDMLDLSISGFFGSQVSAMGRHHVRKECLDKKVHSPISVRDIPDHLVTASALHHSREPCPRASPASCFPFRSFPPCPRPSLPCSAGPNTCLATPRPRDGPRPHRAHPAGNPHHSSRRPHHGVDTREARARGILSPHPRHDSGVLPHHHA